MTIKTRAKDFLIYYFCFKKKNSNLKILLNIKNII